MNWISKQKVIPFTCRLSYVVQYCLTEQRRPDRSLKPCLCPLVAWVVQPRSKRVNNLFLTPIVRKLENLSAEGSRSGAVLLVGSPYVRLLIPKSSLLDSVLIHLLNIYINRMMASCQHQICTNFVLCIKCNTSFRMASDRRKISRCYHTWAKFRLLWEALRPVWGHLGGGLQKIFFSA